MITYLGSLVQLCCGQGRILQTDISGMCRECSKSGPHVVFPHSGHVFSWSTLLSLQLALQGNCLKWALGCVHFPGVSCSGSGFLGAPQRYRLSWACVLCRFQVQAAQVTWCLVSALSPGGWCILSPPWSQPLGFLGVQWEPCLTSAVCLLWGADL